MAEPTIWHRATQSDAALTGQASAPASFVDLVHEHQSDVYRYACRLCGCPSEAEDLTQQTFLIAYRRLDQLRDHARARGWLLAIVRRCFLKSLRKARPAAAQDVSLNVDEVADRTPNVSQIDREELHSALQALPNDFRVVLLMFYFEELSYHEIAAELELPIGTVMSRLSRAKGHLRKKLAPAQIPKPRRARGVHIPAAGRGLSFVNHAPLRATS